MKPPVAVKVRSALVPILMLLLIVSTPSVALRVRSRLPSALPVSVMIAQLMSLLPRRSG